MKLEPLVSIILPSFNAEIYLQTTIQSLLAQTYKNIEILFIDDGSTDKSEDVVYGFKSSKINYYKIKHAGIPKAINYGISKARGELIAIQDADDCSHPDRIEKQVEYLSNNLSVSMVGTSIAYFTNSINKTWKVFFPTNHNQIISELNKFNYAISHPSIMFRNKALPCPLYPLNEEFLPDYCMIINYSKKFLISNVDQIFYYVRISETSFTQNNLKQIVYQGYQRYRKPDRTIAYNFRRFLFYASVYHYKKGLFYFLNNNFLYIPFFLLSAISNPSKVFGHFKKKFKHHNILRFFQNRARHHNTIEKI